MIDLNAEESLRVEQGTSIEVTCLSGVVWITQERDVRDLFLAPGESIWLRRRGLALITALERSAVDIRELAEATTPLHSSARSWFERTISAVRGIRHWWEQPRWVRGVVTKIRTPMAG